MYLVSSLSLSFNDIISAAKQKLIINSYFHSSNFIHMIIPLAKSFLRKVSLTDSGVICISSSNGSNTRPTSREYISKPSVVAAAHACPAFDN